MKRTPFLWFPPLLIGLLFTLTKAHPQRTPDSSPKFSHRRHLALAGTDCEDCHVGAKISQNVSDNNLPNPEVCRFCHDGIHAMKHENLESAYVFARTPKTLQFSHQQHLALGNVAPALTAALDSGTYLGSAVGLRQQLETGNSCEACHRGLRNSDISGPVHYPQMADCLVCHPKIDPPFSCELCHTKEARIKPDSHTQDYIDLHSSKNAKLDKPSCKICHGTGFRCMGCH
jgi:hypothetical protein